MSRIVPIGKEIAVQLNAALGVSNVEFRYSIADQLENVGDQKIYVVPSGLNSELAGRRFVIRTYRYDCIILHKMAMRGGVPKDTEIDGNFETLEAIISAFEQTIRAIVIGPETAQLSQSIEPIEITEPLAEIMFNDAALFVSGSTVTFQIKD